MQSCEQYVLRYVQPLSGWPVLIYMFSKADCDWQGCSRERHFCNGCSLSPRVCVLYFIFLAKVVYERMNQRHPQSRHTPHGGSEKTDTEKGTRARKRKRAQVFIRDHARSHRTKTRAALSFLPHASRISRGAGGVSGGIRGYTRISQKWVMLVSSNKVELTFGLPKMQKNSQTRK